MMELSSKPRHQIRAQGRRRGHAGVVIVEHETSRLRWHPGAQRPGAATVSAENAANFSIASGVAAAARRAIAVEKGAPSPNSMEILEFLSRSAVQSERELLSALDEPATDVSADASVSAQSHSVREFKRILTSVQRNDRPAFRAEAGSESGVTSVDAGSVMRHSVQKNGELLFAPAEELFPEDEAVEPSPADESGHALRSLLKELNAWLSASNQAAARDGNDASVSDLAANVTGAKSVSAITGNAAQQDRSRLKSRFGFEQAKDWSSGNFAGPAGIADAGESRNKLSPFFEAARRMVVGVRNLPLGRRLESHENGAVLEKDELGRVTQIRSASSEIISIYYGKDGAPEGFVRTDSKGKMHSVAECDGHGVVLRDQKGRVRAQGESLCIDPLGRISICRADGQYWSIDLARQMLSEKRRLADPTGRWNALTAVFAADGFRMMTLFQKLSPDVDKKVSSPADANRIWSTASVEKGSFRFYGRDGSTIEFDSEESLANLAPSNVSSPAVRPIEPCWQAKHQAGTAWQSVHEYVISYLAV
jgi:hypothetical protein